MRPPFILFAALLFFSTRAVAEQKIWPVDASAAEWVSGEGLKFRLAGGVGYAFHKTKIVSVAHGFDVLSRDDAYHHWQLGLNSGLNGAYAGVRYQNKSHADQYEAGVTLGTMLSSFGFGAIYDGEEKKLQAVVLRVNLAVIAIPIAFAYR